MDAIIIAFSMYSKIPMPKREWSEKGMKYAICFFPFVGIVEGVIMYFLGLALFQLKWKGIFLPCFMSIAPLLYTGGIHMDGFLDTMDGISSYQSREKRLEILKDSHSGAFAIIGGICYMALSIGAWSELSARWLLAIALGYVLSRAISGLCMVQFKQARENGMVATFSNGADKKTVTIVMILYIVAVLIAAFLIQPVFGCILLGVAILSTGIHLYNCMHNFGGITGDLAGFFLEVMELMLLIACMVAEIVMNC